MRYLILLIPLIAFGIQCCNVGSTKVWKDKNIEQRLKDEIETLDKKVVEAVTNQDTELLRSIMSDKLLEMAGDSIGQLLEQVNDLFAATDYKILNQFHTKNSTTGIENLVFSGAKELNDYVIHYQALNEEMFISLLISKVGYDEFLMTNIYGKYPDGWKLNILQFGQYKVNGKTAPELYRAAKEEYESGYLMDAANNMFLSSRVTHPANQFWQYQHETEVKEFYETVITELNAKYRFPMILEAIDSRPQIVTIYPQGTVDGYFPAVEYITNLDLEDTVRTKEEYEKVHSEMVRIFNGIDKNKPYVFYKAYSKMPDGKTPVPTYGFVKELN